MRNHQGSDSSDAGSAVIRFQLHPGQGPCLLLLHGVLSNSAQWQPNLQALGAVCTPVTAELLGHGDSPAPDDPAAYTPAAYVDAIEAVRKELGAKRLWLCGYSLSAALTVRYALTYPERVAGHLFTNSLSGFAEAKQAATWRTSGERTRDKLRQRGRAQLENLPLHPRHARSLAPELHAALLARAERLDPIGVGHTLAVTVPAASVRAEVSRNQAPALLLHGVRERRFGPYVEYLRGQMPQLTISQLPAGHAVNMQAAEQFNTEAIRFIQQCPISSTN